MTYDFAVEQLHKMNLVHEDKDPRGLYEYVHGKKPETTEVVEDLAIASIPNSIPKFATLSNEAHHVQHYRSRHCVRSYQSDPFVLVL